MTTRFEYQPLCQSKCEIRLLKLLPSATNDGLIPACHVFHSSLSEDPKFVALSYVWGDAIDSRVILLEDRPIRVTKNLYEAMMALRPVKRPMIVWIDSLCINQSDYSEKSWQVGLMANIYRHACKVVAWLGTAADDSEQIMDYLNSLGAKAEACGMHGYPQLYQKVWQELALNTPAAHGTSPTVTTTTAADRTTVPRASLQDLFYSISGWHNQDNLLPVAGIQRLFTRPWWGRIWVLQEIALPERAEFLCGTKMISIRRCNAALTAYIALWLVLVAKSKQEPTSLTLYQLSITSVLFHIRPTLMLSSRTLYKVEEFPLAALLRATCVGSINPRRHGPHHLESTDPRDKIFALLGLAADRDELETLGVVPDYSKSAEETYTTAMSALLQQGHVSLLSFCQMPKLLSGLPSWVPDWSRSITDMLQHVESDHLTLYPKFSASGADSRNAEISITRKNGAISGISIVCNLYDEIHEAASFPNRVSSHEVPLKETYSWPAKWLLEILRLTYHSKQCYTDFRARLLAATRTSIGGVGTSQDEKSARIGEDRFIDAVVLLKRAINDIKEARIRVGIQQLLADKTVREMVKSRDGMPQKLDSEIVGRCLGRLPFVTKRGHLVLGYDYVRRGDVVALVRGAQMPYVFRRQSEGRYRVIGEAYVDGIMDGEAMDKSTCGSVELV